MKKTIIINIGNSIIHIEEDAYEILTAYLNEIKQHFTGNADDLEIVADIENRIAEMFADKLLDRTVNVITLADVEEVISQMGRVQDFEAEQGQEGLSATAYNGVKKLYRDADDVMIAGVCAGLGHYLNIEARWVRILALCSIFLYGAGILAYIILWIAIPRAITRSERMEMKGESTNLYGYKRNFEEELAAFNERMRQAGGDFKPLKSRSTHFITELFSAIGRLFSALGKLFSKTIAGIIVVAGFAILIGLIISLAAFLGFWDTEAYQYFPFSIIDESYRSELAFSAFFILFIPVLALVLFSIRVAFNKTTLNKSLSFGLLIVWLGAVSVGVYYAAKISSEFKEHAELEQTTVLKSFPVYVLNVDKGMVFNQKDSVDYQLKNEGFQRRIIVDDSEDHPFRIPRNVHVQIEKSESGKPMLIQNFEAQGKTFQVALQNAKNIDYKFTQQAEVLTFSPRISLKNNANWRNQEVHLTLKLPIGTHVKINDNLYSYLYFYYHNCTADEAQYTEYKEWVMTEEGLKCKADLNETETPKP